jgi:hypothetical protein
VEISYPNGEKFIGILGEQESIETGSGTFIKEYGMRVHCKE